MASFTTSHICAIGDLKPRRATGNDGKFGDDEKGHVLGMVEDLVREQSWRAIAMSASDDVARVVAFLSDGLHIVFFQCRLHVNMWGAGVIVSVVGIEEWPPLLLEGLGGQVLFGLTRAEPSEVGYGMPSFSLQGDPIESLSFLGMGSTSLTFSGK